MNKNSQHILPSRSKYKYIEEEFESYELTHCVAYEMAIRNDNVKYTINLLDKLASLHKELTLSSLLNNPSFCINFCLDEIYESIVEYNKVGCKKVDYIEIDDWDESTLDVEIKTSNFIMKIIVELCDFLEQEYYMVHQRETIIPERMEEVFNGITDYEADSKLNEHMEEAILNSNHYKDGYIIKDGYVVYQGAYEEDYKLSCFKIKPNFKKPLKQFNQTEVSLNISLPKNELVAYIKKIKDDYDKKESSIPNFLEFLGKELGFDPDVYKNMTAKKWADHFYIYDVMKSFNRKRLKEEIRFELTKYHGVKVFESEKMVKVKVQKNGKTVEEEKLRKKYKYVPYKKYKQENPDMELEDFNDMDDEKAAISTKAISNYYELMQKLIEDENPQYKSLIAR